MGASYNQVCLVVVTKNYHMVHVILFNLENFVKPDTSNMALHVFMMTILLLPTFVLYFMFF